MWVGGGWDGLCMCACVAWCLCIHYCSPGLPRQAHSPESVHCDLLNRYPYLDKAYDSTAHGLLCTVKIPPHTYTISVCRAGQAIVEQSPSSRNK